MKKLLFAFSIVVLLAAGCSPKESTTGWPPINSTTTPPNPGGIACTQEAKLCPDGSYVGRTEPNCEFAACPMKPISGSITPVSALSISRLSPASGPIDTQITITGKGFTPTGNAVTSNNLQLAGNLSSSNGTTLRFAFPSSAGAYCPKGQACPMYFLQLTPGVYPLSVINSNGTSNAITFTATSGQGNQIIKGVGEKEGSFLIQKINLDSVEGLWYQAYPVATNQGTPKTLRIGDDIGYACEGVSEKLTSIDFYGQKIIFTKTLGPAPLGGCPI